MPQVSVVAETTSSLLSVNDKPRLILPSYQRDYVWKPELSRQLWDDMFHHLLSENQAGNDPTPYFLGNVIIEQQLNPAERHLVDGQQRLTAISRMACAVRDALLIFHEEKGTPLALTKAVELQNDLLIYVRDDIIYNRLQPQDRPEGAWLSSLIKHQWYQQLNHSFENIHFVVNNTAQENNLITITPNGPLPWWIRSGTKLPVFRDGEKLTQEHDGEQKNVYFKFARDVNINHNAELELTSLECISPNGAELQPDDEIKLEFTRKKRETDSNSNAEFDAFVALRDDFLNFITEGDGGFLLYPVAQFPNGMGVHIQNANQRIDQFILLLKETQYACCGFTSNALSYFRKMNDQGKMTMLETIDLMVAVTSEITSGRPNEPQSDAAITDYWRKIFEKLFLQSGKKADAAKKFFYYFLLSQGKTQHGRGGRYSEKTSFKGIEEHYTKSSLDPIAGWNKQEMVIFYRTMDESSNYFLDAWQPEKRQGYGIFLDNAANRQRKLEQFLLRALSDSGFIQHIPPYMAACQVFANADRRNDFVSKFLRKIVYYFLRGNSIPSARDRKGLTGNVIYGLGFGWCKMIQDRNRIPCNVNARGQQIEDLNGQITALRQEKERAQDHEVVELNRQIDEKNVEISALKNPVPTNCTNADIDDLLEAITSDIENTIRGLAENVPWNAANLNRLKGTAPSTRLILWCNEISEIARDANYADGDAIPMNLNTVIPYAGIQVEHICPKNPDDINKWPAWWRVQTNHDNHVESLANKMLLEQTHNLHVLNYDLDFKRKPWEVPQELQTAVDDAQREVENAQGLLDDARGDEIVDAEGVHRAALETHTTAIEAARCFGPGTCQHYNISNFKCPINFSQEDDEYQWNKGKLDERARRIADNLLMYWGQ